MDSQALFQVHINQIMAVEYPTFHHWVDHCLIITENNQVQTRVCCHFLLQEMKWTITPQVVVIPFLGIEGIRCHHGNNKEEETTKEDLFINQVLVPNFFQGAQEISEQISYNLSFIDLHSISVFCSKTHFILENTQ